MIPGVTAVAVVPVASLPPGLGQSTPDPFADLLATVQSTADLIFLLQAMPFDRSQAASAPGLPAPVAVLPVAGGPDFTYLGAERTVRASARGYITGPSDIPAHEPFPPRLVAPLSREVSIPIDAGGAAAQSFGVIVLANGDGQLDDWLGYAWDGRSVEILAGKSGFSLAEFGPLYRGTSDGLTWTESEIRIRLRDGREAFAVDVPAGRYGGTGGAEGGADLAGRPKPVCLGRVINATPVLIDASNLVYQVGQDLRDVDAVRDRGVALTAAGDVPDIFATTVAGGSYKTDLASGLIRLGATPAGTVTVDAQGPAAAGDTAGALVRYIATTLLGAASLPKERLELGSFADLDAAQPAAVNLYLDAERRADAVVDELLAGIGAWWTVDREGRLRVGRLDAPNNSIKELTDEDIGSLQREPLAPPVWRHRLDHGRSWTVQGDDDLAESVGAAGRELYGRAFRSATATDTVARGRHRLARDIVVQAPFDELGDAQAEADRLQALFGEPRELYRVVVRRGLFKFDLGQTITLRYPRFGLTAGQDLVVVGLVEDVGRDRTELRVWG